VTDDDNKRESEPATLPPASLTTPSPDIAIRESDPDMVLANAPPHIQLTVRELRETRELINKREAAALEREIAEQKRADVRHDDAQQLQKELLQLPMLKIALGKVERLLEQLRRELVTTRKDIGHTVARIDLLDVRMDDHHQRIVAIEAHVGVAPGLADDDSSTESPVPPESDP
jgi:hypothetical protein